MEQATSRSFKPEGPQQAVRAGLNLQHVDRNEEMKEGDGMNDEEMNTKRKLLEKAEDEGK